MTATASQWCRSSYFTLLALIVVCRLLVLGLVSALKITKADFYLLIHQPRLEKTSF